MYFAKRLDRNCYRFFSASMNAAASRNLLVENRLRHALASEGVRLHYQPLTNIDTGEVSGAEVIRERRLTTPTNRFSSSTTYT